MLANCRAGEAVDGSERQTERKVQTKNDFMFALSGNKRGAGAGAEQHEMESSRKSKS